jgi:hypothetical protein
LEVPFAENNDSHNTHSTPSSDSGATLTQPNNPTSLGGPTPPNDADRALKRRKNTLAARKYRQKRVDRIKELEGAVDELTKERDELRLRLARQEAETAALREVLRMKG